MALIEEAIRIPSKNIYRIENQKVIDNRINKIELSANNVFPDNKYNESLYSVDINDNFEIESEAIRGEDVKLYSTTTLPSNPVAYFFCSCVYADKQYYVSKVVNIPVRNSITQKISDIFLGLKDGEKQIKYSCSGRIIKGTAVSTISATAYLNTEGIYVNQWFYVFSPPTYDYSYHKQEETTGNYNIPTEYDNPVESEDGSLSVNGHIDIPTKDNLGTVTASKVTIDGQDYLQLNLQNILCGIRIFESGGRITAGPTDSSKRILSGKITNGTYIQYIPEIVTVTFYGNTIGIDLKENSITIGNGKDIYSFDGNELIQDTNIYVNNRKIFLEKGYNSFLNRVNFTIKNGVKLNVGDKIKYQNKTLVVQRVSGDIISFYDSTFGMNLDNGTVIKGTYIDENTSIENKYQTIINSWDRGKEIATLTLSIDDYYSDTNLNKKLISPNLENYPMTLDIGNKVVPYVYVKKGVDKPMSLTMNGEPKQFEVVGKKMIYDGAVWQELKIREYIASGEIVSPEQETETITISVVGVDSGGYPLPNVNLVIVADGTLNVGDLIVYNNEQAVVTGKQSNSYIIQANTNGAFQQAIGQSIQVTVL